MTDHVTHLAYEKFRRRLLLSYLIQILSGSNYKNIKSNFIMKNKNFVLFTIIGSGWRSKMKKFAPHLFVQSWIVFRFYHWHCQLYCLWAELFLMHIKYRDITWEVVTLSFSLPSTHNYFKIHYKSFKFSYFLWNVLISKLSSKICLCFLLVCSTDVYVGSPISYKVLLHWRWEREMNFPHWTAKWRQIGY